MEEQLPDPTNLVRTSAYLYQQAELGHFEHAHDLAVMQYLWLYTWRKPDNKENAQVGMVMQGKSPVPAICQATMLGRTSAKAALRRLRNGGWIETEQGTFETGWKTSNYVFLRLDTSSHRERERERSVMAEVARFMKEGRVATS
jgi:hypothetical protein